MSKYTIEEVGDCVIIQLNHGDSVEGICLEKDVFHSMIVEYLNQHFYNLDIGDKE